MSLSYGYPNDGAPDNSDYVLYNLDPNLLNGKQLIPGPGIAITVMGTQVIVSNTGGGGGSTQTYVTELDERATLPGSLRVIQGANMLITINSIAGTITFSSTASGGGGSGAQSFITVNDESGTLAGGRQFKDGANVFSLDAGPGTTFTISVENSTTDTGTVTLTATSNKVRFANAAGGVVTYNLPAASGCLDKEFNIKKLDSSVNLVNIVPHGTDNIEGVNSTITIPIQYMARLIHCDGTGWWIL